MFDWCGTSVQSRAAIREDLAAATAKARALENAVAELKAQLDEFLRAKESDEMELLEKFRRLLNEKKLKIRE